MATRTASERLAAFWNRQAGRYDRRMERLERKRLGGSRRWVCAQAEGDVLDVCIGTGLDLPAIPAASKVTGLDLSAEMLERTRRTSLLLEAAGFAIEESDRHSAGSIEHVRARPI